MIIDNLQSTDAIRADNEAGPSVTNRRTDPQTPQGPQTVATLHAAGWELPAAAAAEALLRAYDTRLEAA